jgi:hypothetical protein
MINEANTNRVSQWRGWTSFLVHDFTGHSKAWHYVEKLSSTIDRFYES